MQHKRPGTVRRIAGILALFALFLTPARPAAAQTPTQEIAECIFNAFDELMECIDDLPWWAEVLCDARFYADVILCLPKIVLSGGEE
jgi:predicted lipoprotein